jgi:hypothetical protein
VHLSKEPVLRYINLLLPNLLALLFIILSLSAKKYGVTICLENIPMKEFADGLKEVNLVAVVLWKLSLLYNLMTICLNMLVFCLLKLQQELSEIYRGRVFAFRF